MRHPGARKLVIAHQAHQVRLIGRIGADPEKATGQLFRDTADHLQIEGGDLALEGRKVPGDIRGAVCSPRGPFPRSSP